MIRVTIGGHESVEEVAHFERDVPAWHALLSVLHFMGTGRWLSPVSLPPSLPPYQFDPVGCPVSIIGSYPHRSRINK